MSACRSCGAEITWVVTALGKRMPVDTEPVDGGNVLLSDERTGPDRLLLATVVGKAVQPNLFGDDSPRYVSHFATCPHANEHRRTPR